MCHCKKRGIEERNPHGGFDDKFVIAHIGGPVFVEIRVLVFPFCHADVMFDEVGGKVGIIIFYIPMEHPVRRRELVRCKNSDQVCNGYQQQDSPTVEIPSVVAYYLHLFQWLNLGFEDAKVRIFFVTVAC